MAAGDRLANHGKETWESILVRTLTQVNANGLLRKVHAAEEGLEVGAEAKQ